MTDELRPLAAFDVTDGTPSPISSSWPDIAASADYRWLHLDLADRGLRPWVEAHLPEIAAGALLQRETRPRCERLGDGLILNLRGVNLNPEADPEDMVSLRMWVTGSAIVSARIRRIWVVDAMRQAAEAGSAPATVGAFLAELTHGLTDRIETVSLDLEEQTDELEDLGADGGMVMPDRISQLRQSVIKMRRFINPQREAINTLASLDRWIFTSDELALLRETSNRTRRIVEELDATRDRLSALQDHVDADRTAALSRNSYVLSIVAAIFLPLGFLTGLFGVNVAGMPGTETPSAFWLLTGASALVGVLLFAIFKFARWL
ncbi:MAG: zinc transporter ZntB [Pseudomonadota bacterium]